MNLQDIYCRLFAGFGPQGWWPGDNSYEHFAGCILAQNTRWDRVEPVLARLKKMDLLPPSEFLRLKENELAELLRGSGTYRRKAGYLQNAGRYMLSLGWDGTPKSVDSPTGRIRGELLSLKGIGPETCDCILLYVLERPVFVVDAYTKRILGRHGLCRERSSYSVVQKSFHSELDADVEVFQEYHALLVACAKEYCRPAAKCQGCPLQEEGFE